MSCVAVRKKEQRLSRRSSYVINLLVYSRGLDLLSRSPCSVAACQSPGPPSPLTSSVSTMWGEVQKRLSVPGTVGDIIVCELGAFTVWVVGRLFSDILIINLPSLPWY